MRKFKFILLIISILLCAFLLFGCANETPKGAGDPDSSRAEEKEPEDKDEKNENEETTKNEETTGVDDQTKDTTIPPEDTTAVPADTTAKPVDTTAKPVDTTVKPVDTTARPVETTPPVQETPKVEKPSDELIKQIEEDYTAYLMEVDSRYNPKIDGTYPIMRYYGQVAGWIPVMFRQAETGAIMEIKIAESTFRYGGNNSIMVWKNGDFLLLDEAYEKGFLTEEQIAIIADIHNHGKFYRCCE